MAASSSTSLLNTSWLLGAAAAGTAEDDTRAENDDLAWRAALAELGPRLLLFARQWVRCPADAEDIVQDAFVRCWRRHRARAAESPALFFAAVRSSALDFLRREQRRQTREAKAAEEAAPLLPSATTPSFESTTAAEDSAARTAVLEAALGTLPVEQREVLVLKIWSELTFADIAAVLGIKPDTAASRFRYALAALRKQLSPSSVD